MSKDRLIGGLLFAGGILGIIVYGYLVFSPWSSILILQITAFIAVLGLLAVLAWIGWTMATTPPVEPIPPEAIAPSSSTQPAEGEKK